MNVDITRHRDVFNSEKFHDTVHVIGVGATGSFLVLQLAKLGIQNIHVWDFDKVEEHNVSNQLYSNQDIGVPKVEALYNIIKGQTGTELHLHNQKYVNQPLQGYVFLMVDSMEARKKILEAGIEFKPLVKHLIEPRMGVDVGRVYNVNPMNINQLRKYKETLYDDEETEVSACGTSLSVITSAMTIASWCSRQLIEHFNGENVDNEILIDFKYNNILSYKWDE